MKLVLKDNQGKEPAPASQVPKIIGMDPEDLESLVAKFKSLPGFNGFLKAIVVFVEKTNSKVTFWVAGISRLSKERQRQVRRMIFQSLSLVQMSAAMMLFKI